MANVQVSAQPAERKPTRFHPPPQQSEGVPLNLLLISQGFMEILGRTCGIPSKKNRLVLVPTVERWPSLFLPYENAPGPTCGTSHGRGRPSAPCRQRCGCTPPPGTRSTWQGQPPAFWLKLGAAMPWMACACHFWRAGFSLWRYWTTWP